MQGRSYIAHRRIFGIQAQTSICALFILDSSEQHEVNQFSQGHFMVLTIKSSFPILTFIETALIIVNSVYKTIF